MLIGSPTETRARNNEDVRYGGTSRRRLLRYLGSVIALGGIDGRSDGWTGNERRELSTKLHGKSSRMILKDVAHAQILFPHTSQRSTYTERIMRLSLFFSLFYFPFRAEKLHRSAVWFQSCLMRSRDRCRYDHVTKAVKGSAHGIGVGATPLLFRRGWFAAHLKMMPV